MAEIKKILFPVDFTASSDKVLPYVKLMADKLGAKVSLVHVVRGAEEFAGFEMGAAWYSSFEKELIDGAEKAMSRFVEENGLNDAETAVLVGDAGEELVKYAEENGIDMIIMGTHGRKGLEKIMFGSVAAEVVKKAKCPVLTVNPFKQ
jgi:nucleotide-binding universal stress UspA family protein